ncbi:MAG: sulfurtransferase complex subunit TusB [Candidatus Thermoplasmatota archaeon]|nr:sulfurtransferase complex subunit TusB [Candidatus Thermoplasmatota archaeon]
MVSVLFLLFKSPFKKNVAELIESFECKKAVVLFENAVYYKNYPENTDVFVLKDDAEARGVSADAKMIDYNDAVELIEKYDRVVTL